MFFKTCDCRPLGEVNNETKKTSVNRRFYQWTNKSHKVSQGFGEPLKVAQIIRGRSQVIM